MTYENVRQAIHQACLRLEAEGLIAESSGNVSVRLPPEDGRELFAVTPSSIPYRALRPDQIVVIDYDKNVVDGEGRPSSETNAHLAAYRARPDAGAVIHSHSPYASACAVAGIDIPALLDEQVVGLGGGVRCAAFGMSASEELANNAVEALGDRMAVLLRSHGILGVGRTLDEAMAVVGQVERTARIFVLAQSLGNVQELPATVVELEQKFYRIVHGRPVDG
jgi:L-fuculose-phosphate aldolase